MRIVRILVSILLLAFGFVVAIAVMLFSLVARLFGRAPARPAFNVRFQRAATSTPPRPTANQGDVIDIEATPVKD